MIAEVAESLASCPLFRDVESHRLTNLLERAGARVERHPAGRLVRQQGDRYDALVLLASGRLEARFDSSSGKGMAVEHFEAPSAVATAILMSSDPVLPVSLVAEEDAVLATVAYEEMLALLGAEPAILKAYLRDSGDKVRFLAEKIRLLRFGSLRSKIASHLLNLAAEPGSDTVRWRYGRERMAELLGAARPSLSRELSRMVEDGLLEMPDRSLVRLDREALEAVLEED